MFSSLCSYFKIFVPFKAVCSQGQAGIFLFSYLITLIKFSRFNWKVNLFFLFLLSVLFIPLISQRSSQSFHHLPQSGLLLACHTPIIWVQDIIAFLTWIHCFLDHFLLSCFMTSCCWYICYMSCNFLIKDAVSSRLFVLSEPVPYLCEMRS